MQNGYLIPKVELRFEKAMGWYISQAKATGKLLKN